MTSRYLKKNEKELETLIQTIRIYNQDKGMEFSIQKGVMMIRKLGERKTMGEIELADQENIKILGRYRK